MYSGWWIDSKLYFQLRIFIRSSEISFTGITIVLYTLGCVKIIKKTFLLNSNKIMTILCVSFIVIKISYLTVSSYNCHNMDVCPLPLLLFLLKFLILFLYIKVCEEQSCEDQVFPLSVNFLDRFLCACDISKTHLQLTGAVCLLLASKVRQCSALSIELLCYYTENSVTPEEMRVNIADEIIF